MKTYQVIFVDENNIFYDLGFFRSLEDAEPELNLMLENYTFDEEDEEHPGEVPQFSEDGTLGRLVEWQAAFDTCFDREIYTSEGTIQVRGFIFDSEAIIAKLQELEKGEKEDGEH